LNRSLRRKLVYKIKTSSAYAIGNRIEQDELHFGNCGFYVCLKIEEAKEEHIDMVMAMETCIFSLIVFHFH